jgi:hypothetical protein
VRALSALPGGIGGAWPGPRGENDALCRMGGAGPGLFNVGQWYGPGVDVEGAVGDLLGQCGQFGEDFASGDGALPAAYDREVGGAERG